MCLASLQVPQLCDHVRAAAAGLVEGGTDLGGEEDGFGYSLGSSGAGRQKLTTKLYLNYQVCLKPRKRVNGGGEGERLSRNTGTELTLMHINGHGLAEERKGCVICQLACGFWWTRSGPLPLASTSACANYDWCNGDDAQWCPHEAPAVEG